MKTKQICKHCGGDVRIRNPSGYCDHLYYPDYCKTCKKNLKGLRKVHKSVLLSEPHKTVSAPRKTPSQIAEKICRKLEPRLLQLLRKFATGNCNLATMPAFWIGAEADIEQVLNGKT